MIELMITLTVLAVVMVVLTTVMYTAGRSKTATSNRIESAQAGRVAVDMMARDLRSAGYGADLDWLASPQQPFAYADSLQILINANLQPYPDTLSNKRGWPLAYSPIGSPKPFPLNGTQWTPPLRFHTGAEIVRWTLDVNNDGQVNAADIAAAEGVDAQRTANPDDYVLLRQVYGDSTPVISGGPAVSGNNGGGNGLGGGPERIALVKKPGGTVPPMFTVYMKSKTTPYDWSLGPVPAGQLKDIERVVIRVVAPSGRPDWRGKYAETNIETTVYGIRNVPNFGVDQFLVDGYVFNDANRNDIKDVAELGLSGVSVQLGSFLSTVTNAVGYFQFNAAAGTYTLRHKPPGNFGVRTNPDSFVVTVGPATSHSFADTALAGGWVTATVFEDLNTNNVKDTGEPVRQGEKLTITPGNQNYQYTDTTGVAKLWGRVGGYTLTLTVPDSFVCGTSNPATGTMTNGGSASHLFAVSRSTAGTVKGQVWQDKNANGVNDPGETGVSNVWVGVASSDGTVLTYDYTDGSGKYALDVPANDPPKTNAYSIQIIPPTGYYPTTTSVIEPIWVKANTTYPNNDFGVNSFTKITLNSNRVLSLGSGDLIEKDWSGTKTGEARGDADLVLGADASGTDQISVWFNQYNSNTLFSSNRSYARTAPNSVLSLAVDSLSEDAAPFSGRMDVVTGTTYATAGNFFVWYTQATSGNEGYLGTTYNLPYKTSDNGDVQAVVTGDLTGTLKSDIIVGTKSPTAGQGSIEIWRGNGAAQPTYSRLEVYPPKGCIPSNNLGEVTGLALADFRSCGVQDLVVVTKKSSYSGQVLFFRGNGTCTGSSFSLDQIQPLGTQAATCMAICDYDEDGLPDIVVGTQTGFSAGKLLLWHNISQKNATKPVEFALDDSVSLTNAIPLSLGGADLGGDTNPDIVMGYRSDATSYTGGVRIYYMDGAKLPAGPVDPSGGTVTGMVPAINVNNFNYGVKPSLPSLPYLTDIAAGIKTSPTTGALVIFLR